MKKKRYSQSDMQIKHYLCSVNKTLPKFQRKLSLRSVRAESTHRHLGWGLLPRRQPERARCNPGKVLPLNPAPVVLSLGIFNL